MLSKAAWIRQGKIGLSVVVAGVAVALLSAAQPVTALAVAMSFLLLLPGVVQWRLHGRVDVFSPHVVFNAFFLLAFVAKPIYVIAVRAYAPTYDKLPLTGDAWVSVVTAATVSFIAIAGWTIGYLASNAAASPPRKDVAAAEPAISRWRSLVIQLIAMAVALTALGNVFDALTPGDRFGAFYNRGYLLAIIELGKPGFFLWTGSLLMARDRTWPFTRVMWLVAFGLLAGIDLLMGLRSGFLIFNVLIIAVVVHYRVRQFRLLPVAAALLVILFLFLGYRTVTRDTLDPRFRGTNVGVLLQRNLSSPFQALLGGVEVGQFDSLVIAVDGMPRHLPFQYGKTLLSAVYYPIPRALYPNKPEGAAVTFTDAFYPGYSGGVGVRLAISAVTELYMNGATPAVLVGMLLVGYGSGYLYLRRFRRGTMSALWYALFLGSGLIGLRGDMVNGVIDFVIIAVPLFMFERLAVIQQPKVAAI